jgi:hypothetical protein
VEIVNEKDNIQDRAHERARNYLCLSDGEKDAEISKSIIRLNNHIYYTLYLKERDLRTDRPALAKPLRPLSPDSKKARSE